MESTQQAERSRAEERQLNLNCARVGKGSLVQYSVFMTGSRRGAMAVERLARHYGASVMVFKGEEIEF